MCIESLKCTMQIKYLIYKFCRIIPTCKSKRLQFCILSKIVIIRIENQKDLIWVLKLVSNIPYQQIIRIFQRTFEYTQILEECLRIHFNHGIHILYQICLDIITTPTSPLQVQYILIISHIWWWKLYYPPVHLQKWKWEKNCCLTTLPDFDYI